MPIPREYRSDARRKVSSASVTVCRRAANTERDRLSSARARDLERHRFTLLRQRDLGHLGCAWARSIAPFARSPSNSGQEKFTPACDRRTIHRSGTRGRRGIIRTEARRGLSPTRWESTLRKCLHAGLEEHRDRGQPIRPRYGDRIAPGTNGQLGRADRRRARIVVRPSGRRQNERDGCRIDRRRQVDRCFRREVQQRRSSSRAISRSFCAWITGVEIRPLHARAQHVVARDAPRREQRAPTASPAGWQESDSHRECARSVRRAMRRDTRAGRRRRPRPGFHRR